MVSLPVPTYEEMVKDTKKRGLSMSEMTSRVLEAYFEGSLETNLFILKGNTIEHEYKRINEIV